MRSALSLVTPPASEPVTLADAKAWARVDANDDDALLTGLIAAARSAAEEYLRRSLIDQTWRLTLDLCGSGRAPFYEGVYDLPVNYFDGDLSRALELPRGPVSAVTSVTTYDANNVSSVFNAAGYRLDGSRLVLNPAAYWPTNLRPRGGTEVVYIAGYGTAARVPQPIRTGILIHVASLYEQRGLCDDAAALPPGAAHLYAPYRLMGDARA